MPSRGGGDSDEGHVSRTKLQTDKAPGDLGREVTPFHASYRGSDPEGREDSYIGFQCVAQNIKDDKLCGEPSFHVRLEEWFVGGLTQDVRVLIRFQNVPDGVRLGVKNKVVGLPASSPLGVIRIDGADAFGAGGQIVTSRDDEVWEVPITGRVGYVVYEVAYASHLALSRIDVPVIAGWSGGAGPKCGSMHAATDQCPISKEYPPPAGTYVDTGGNPTVVLSIISCTTTLLFPNVTSQAGCDTSIAITNTSEDYFGTQPRDGLCTIHYHGSMSAGGPLPPDKSSDVIRAGEQLTFSVAKGNPSKGIDPAPGFQGYIYVVCEFQPAHGMAIVTDNDGGIPGNGYTYMAIVQHQDPDPR